ncbi:hypothetical protein D9619_008741 [Psilocybe cf. subviscida]|uniref:Zinc finger PHD-type domain-containing protein n=1 Tax=Psilocybe cf. subviscida TaxID=2480587 RepID=A0A8H5B9K3_9AGAR|nr:hypothetical protein D9619_008741 [Psilocybe cf. subviscida]
MTTGFFRHLASFFFPELKKKRKRELDDIGAQSVRPERPDGMAMVPIYNEAGDEVIGYKVAPTKEKIIISEATTRTHSTFPGGPHANAILPTLPTAATTAEQWDGWPNGNFSCDFSWGTFESTKSLMEHWAHEVVGGMRGGDEHALEWENGKRSARRCLGIIQCDNNDCKMIIRPHTKSVRLARQLSGECECGYDLNHIRCNAGSQLWKWSEGVHYFHQGDHHHERPTHILHTSRTEERRFEAIVRAHPTTKALGLQVGVPGIDGPGESVTQISDVFLNVSRVAKERSKIIKGDGSATGDVFIQKLTKFHKDYPGLITDINLDDGAAVISLQSPFMRSLLVRPERLPEPVNGTVNDAAHGWWKERNSLLMISSVYCEVLNRWLPGFISYMDGATTEHYTRHFFGFFRSVILAAEEAGISLNDALFAGVMDLCEAERNGFLNAWMLIWTIFREDPLARDELALYAAGEALLRACKRHFEQQVDRVSNIAEAVKPESKEHFRSRGKALLNSGDSREFLRRVDALLGEFPQTTPWLGWYRRPSHAQMLFETERRMEADIWESIPDTTNAEEAMHWTLYCGFGRKHEFFAGMNALARFTDHIEKLYKAKEVGQKVRYGKPEHHKKIYKYKLTTHPRRVKLAKDNARRKTRRNDGRSYDTKMSLRQANERLRKTIAQKEVKKKQKEKKEEDMKEKNTPGIPKRNQPTEKSNESTNKSIISGPPDPYTLPSFPWKNNSCWLDSSLHILRIVFSGAALKDLEALCDDVGDSGIQSVLFTAIYRASLLNSDFNAQTLRTEMEKIRDSTRRTLKSQMLIPDLSSFETLLGWLTELVDRDCRKDETFRLASLFQAAMVEVHKCTGCEETGGMHVEVTQKPRYQPRITLTDTHHAKYKGSFTNYAREFFALEKEPVKGRCWRVKSGEYLCSGERTDIQNLLISIPVLLVARVEDEGEPWDFPATLRPETSLENIEYDLVALGLFSEQKGHFSARFTTLPGKQDVYAYDGMVNSGCATLIPGAMPATHMYGVNVNLPNSWKVQHVFYYLRGGSKTQDEYYRTRLDEVSATQLLKFTSRSLTTPTLLLFTDEEFKMMSKAHRHWVKDPFRANAIEYLRRDAPDVPYKRIRATPESEDSPPPSPKPSSREGSLLAVEDVDAPSTKGTSVSSLEPPPPQRSSSTIPDSLFDLNCRCGLTGNGNVGYVQANGEAVQCMTCQDWMHVACQQGHADIGPKAKFECERCELLTKGTAKKVKRRIGIKKSPSERLRSDGDEMNRMGCGALVKDGTFWYPVRLIQRMGPRTNGKRKKSDTPTLWRVKWWRGCHFENNSTHVADGMSIVREEDIVDALWKDRTERRRIRLGKWDHAFNSPTPEDILSDPSSIPYSPVVDDALRPHADLLYQLLVAPKDVDRQHVPAIGWVEETRNAVPISKENAPMAWVESSKRDLSTVLIVHTGGLSVVERAQVANWVEVNICKGDKHLRWDWLMKLPNAHALTLYLAHRMQASEEDGVEGVDLVAKAWKVLLTAKELDEGHVDVDREAVVLLEEDMLEDSKRAGIAGSQQWGLDAGDHQERWGVYVGLPEMWRPGDREGTEDELEVRHGSHLPMIVINIFEKRGPGFIEVEPRQVAAVPRPRPKPRPIVRSPGTSSAAS